MWPVFSHCEQPTANVLFGPLTWNGLNRLQRRFLVSTTLVIQVPGDPAAFMEYVNGVLFEEHTPWNNHPVVSSLTPVASIERMKRQEGHFLRSLSYDLAFDLSLFCMIRSKLARPWVANRPLRKLIVTPCHRTAVIEELRRMNIHDDYLFPGSDFAYDLRAELEMRVKKDRRQWTKSISKMLDRGRP